MTGASAGSAGVLCQPVPSISKEGPTFTNTAGHAKDVLYVITLCSHHHVTLPRPGYSLQQRHSQLYDLDLTFCDPGSSPQEISSSYTLWMSGLRNIMMNSQKIYANEKGITSSS